ncbi:proline-rich protein 2-like [Ochotona curzoniae]|uniref:proline-rich protein 2-like n=1 Tax=Ochotona curzoniae TaxID=130825 RepID=UPI001B3542E4|nr:proline-rich protein 2-like [Ochotona curzoniae]
MGKGVPQAGQQTRNDNQTPAGSDGFQHRARLTHRRAPQAPRGLPPPGPHHPNPNRHRPATANHPAERGTEGGATPQKPSPPHGAAPARVAGATVTRPTPAEGGDQGFETGTPEPTHGGTHGTPPAPPTPQQARPASHGPHRHGNNRRPLPPTRDTRRPPFRSPAGTDSQVRPSSQRSARAVGRPRRGRSEGLTKPSNRHSNYHRKLIGQTFEWVVATTEGRSVPGRPADLGSATDGGVLTGRLTHSLPAVPAFRLARGGGKQELAETRPAPRAGRHRRAEVTVAAGDDGEERRRRDDRRGRREPPTGLTPSPRQPPRLTSLPPPPPGGQRSGSSRHGEVTTPRESQPEKPAGETGARTRRPYNFATQDGDEEPADRGLRKSPRRPDLTDINPRAHAPLRQADPPAATPPATAA